MSPYPGTDRPPTGGAPAGFVPPRPPLRRSSDDRYIAGVAGGVAHWLGVDPTLVRVLFVLLALAGGIGGPLYLAAWAIVPEDGGDQALADGALAGTLGAARARVANPFSSPLSWPARTRSGRDPNLRVSDAERQEIADLLSEHYSAGRLDAAEFDERLGRAMAAKTRGELDALLYDLPPLPSQIVPPPTRAPRRRGGGTVALAALTTVVVASFATSGMAPGRHGLWLAVLALLVVARLHGRRRMRL